MKEFSINIRWKNCDLSQTTADDIYARFDTLLNKYNFIIPQAKAEVVCYKNDSKKPFKVRMSLFCKQKKSLRAEFASGNIVSAVAGCFEKLDDQCRRIKTQKSKYK